MRIGDYELTREVGRGSVGRVFLARTIDGREVAIKALLRASGSARFDREARLLGQLGEAQGFVPCLESGESDEVGTYIVMPFLRGGTLRDRLRRGPLAPEETRALGRALARALGRAHALGIVHRDLKPENILFTDAGDPLVADLGLAKHFAHDLPGASRSVSLSQTGALRGTPGYMPREQVKNAKAAGPAADVFSLGAILYECLAGVPPFFAQSFVEVFDKLERGTFAPLARVRPDAPEGLARAIEGALAKEPLDRYPDGDAFLLALERMDEKPRATGRWLGATFVLALVALTATVTWLVLRRPRHVPVPGVTSVAPSPGVAPSQGPVFDPKHALAWAVSARTRSSSGDLAGAFADATKAIDEDPRCATGWAVRADVRRVRGDDEGARVDASHALEIEPANVYALIVRSAAYCHKGELDAAITDAARAIELDPKRPSAWTARGNARHEKRDLPGAIEDMTRALELDPNEAAALLTRAEAHRMRGEAVAAIQDATRALALNPNNAYALGTRAEAYLMTDDLARANADATRSIELDPNELGAWTARCEFRRRSGDALGAIADATRAMEIDPKRPALYVTRADARRMRNELNGAIDDASHALLLEPGRRDAILIRGVVLFERGDLAAARPDLARYLELSASDDPMAARVRQMVAQVDAPTR